MTEIINAVESQFDVTSRSTRPAGYPDTPFKVQTFQVYDDILLRWVDLYSSAQLTNGCQALSEKLRSVFYDIDFGNKGYILYADLRSAFAKADIEFTYATVGELFTMSTSEFLQVEAAAQRGDDDAFEWARFLIEHPEMRRLVADIDGDATRLKQLETVCDTDMLPLQATPTMMKTPIAASRIVRVCCLREPNLLASVWDLLTIDFGTKMVVDTTGDASKEMKELIKSIIDIEGFYLTVTLLRK
eukprot:gene8051-12379_t